MDSRMAAVWICALVMCGIAALANAQTDCTTQLAPVVPCLDYVQGKGKSPSSDCCKGLTDLTKSSPVCLCELAEGRLNLSAAGIAVDLKRALQLPTACKLKDISEGRCAAILAPASAPTGIAPGPGPAMQSGSEPDTAGSKSPTAGGSPNAASAFSASFPLLICSLLVAIEAAWRHI